MSRVFLCFFPLFFEILDRDRLPKKTVSSEKETVKAKARTVQIETEKNDDKSSDFE
jgi:hypothetical protein